jgi:hypothetical protein
MKTIEYNNEKYVCLRCVEEYSIDKTIFSSVGDVEIDMCGELIIGIAIKSMNEILCVKPDNEYVIVFMDVECKNICSVDYMGEAEVFIYRNEKDEIFEIVIYNSCNLADYFRQLKV